ncbi:hypothetical protein L226DRAFT_459589 [Lentinus tigrinus ALCF2SS1-7]|uniref:uncharacterized protein n=1 Tax=Lentinus tigrinus ALCF2SS1-7 TaxID=1328758 RepID=UPI0011662FF7|nr:hypothetical protein L226DRAFT_459589 [Lentinus tigrinus ALCF2SS1-7]
MHFAIPVAAALLTSAQGASAAYNLVKDFSGSSFFNGWEFYGNYDNLTNGDVNYVSAANASAEKLAYVNDAGKVIITLDNTTSVPYNYKRDSVRIATTDYFPVGSVILFDATHLPYGCSVWPSFWTKGINWPAGGEIDIIEAVNLMTYNQMALHTNSGCTQATGVNQTGSTSGTDCGTSSGCTVAEQQANSYGTGFNSAGGGVWATQFDSTGIYIWFWTRDSVPSSVSSATDSIDISSWGTPSAAYPSSSCDITNYFTAQQLVIDITLCGDWAGEASVYASTCGGDGTATACYLNNVINTPVNYTNAYFEISYVKVFSTNEDVLIPSISGSSTVLVTDTATSTATGTSGSSTSTSTSGSGSSGGSNGAAMTGARAYAALGGATLVAAFSWILL